jgi:hypothetical protein
MMLYMNTNQTPSRLDRFVDLLLDKKHPFWKDERQRAVYNEAAAAALMLQTFLVVFVGSIGLLIVGKPVLGLVTAMVLCGTVGQYLMMAVLNRRHVELFPSGWQKQTSAGRRAFALAIWLLYVLSAAWVFASDAESDSSKGALVGGAIGIVVLLGVILARKRKATR